MAQKSTIYLAGGCFWGVEDFFLRLKGVVGTKSGYANTNSDKPVSYEEVCKGITNAAETVKVDYDSSIITLEQILDEFYSIIDPTCLNYQGPDHGTQYRNGIYFVNETDEPIIRKFIEDSQKYFKSKIVTEVQKLKNFFDAEEYHQQYFKKHGNNHSCHVKRNWKK